MKKVKNNIIIKIGISYDNLIDNTYKDYIGLYRKT